MLACSLIVRTDVHRDPAAAARTVAAHLADFRDLVLVGPPTPAALGAAAVVIVPADQPDWMLPAALARTAYMWAVELHAGERLSQDFLRALPRALAEAQQQNQRGRRIAGLQVWTPAGPLVRVHYRLLREQADVVHAVLAPTLSFLAPMEAPA